MPDRYEKRERRGVIAGFLFVLLALFLSGVAGDGEHWTSTTEVLRWFLSFWIPV